MSENYKLKSRSVKNLRADSFHHIVWFVKTRAANPATCKCMVHMSKLLQDKKDGRAGQEKESYDYDTTK